VVRPRQKFPHGVAVTCRSLAPLRWEVAHLVAAGADVPGSAMSFTWLITGFLLDQVEERTQPVHVVELPGQRGGQVESEAVHVHLSTQYRSESMISWRVCGLRTLSEFPVPV